ncbi:MAG: hypothetical protein OS130_01870 [Thermodesulfobacteriota bacterium]|nr:MAG: hypothetical protein OS130_01870 [Thermodesulfobacteriota bacterium]
MVHTSFGTTLVLPVGDYKDDRDLNIFIAQIKRKIYIKKNKLTH